MAEKKPVIDWERIEQDYRAGLLSVREIAATRGVTHTAIQKRAKNGGWERDLRAKITARADAIVAKRMVAAEVATRRVATDRLIIEANALRIAQVRGEHRADINRMRALALRLLAECEAEAGDTDSLAKLGEMLRAPGLGGADRLNDAYLKAISLPQRIKGVKELAETLRILVAMEREAYGLATNEPEPGDVLRVINVRMVRAPGS